MSAAAWGAIGIVVASLISGFVAYRSARTGAANDRETRLQGMADGLLDRQSAELSQVRRGIDELRDKHEECLNRETTLRADVRHLTARVDELAEAAEAAEKERKLKHDWRSFAGSLYVERETARSFIRDGRIADAEKLMDEAERLRADSPLLDSLHDLIERDQP